MPKRTIALLERLVSCGLTNDEFRIVHHMPDSAIATHLKYCTETTEFSSDDSTNAKVRQRLELMARAFGGAGFSVPAKAGVLRALAEAAIAEIPKG